MYQFDTNISKLLTFTLYALSDRVAGALTGFPSAKENLDPLQGSVQVKELLSSVTAQWFCGI
jgi:hypothetical protein